ncbi:uncharacterized protein LOC115540710 [Gadus morhua]|uniref:uncharacterized protein LOC115540710 n=1 Tax=Gadus morhua TaxID=8049 RepID=UPI0011B6434C|nr:uncharacterized protein LOC115540710 [Gadus morhua]
MPAHIMLSYQWDDQPLVKRIHDRLIEHGLPVWMDIEGGVTGNINDAMAAGVEEAAVICPIMTPAYQASRNCKRELSYADSREVLTVPVMLAQDWEASEWLGLVTAGLLWVDFRNAETDDEHFESCVQSLQAEIMYNAGHLLVVPEVPEDVTGDEPEPRERRPPKRKTGRRFLHAQSMLYIRESGGETMDPDSDLRGKVELHEEPGERGSWEEQKGIGCKYFRNVATGGYLGRCGSST